MQELILEKFQVRKSNKEKTKFIDYLKERLSESGYDKEADITVEEKGWGILKSRNIVVGNPKEAELFITAHYDTCAVIPFPNLMAPTNPILFLVFQVLIAIMILVIAGVMAVPFAIITRDALITYNAFLVSLILIAIQLMIGFRSSHTANDNTSGVITITRIMEGLSEEQKSKVCAVYFDNEEKGLFGSAYFSKKHKKDVKGKLLINFDCVGDGNNIVFLAKKKARQDKNYNTLVEVLNDCATDYDGKCLCKKMKPMMFPSDQANFSNGIGVCALRKSPVGMYCARIHTPFDTRCREENVEFLSRAMMEFVEKI